MKDPLELIKILLHKQITCHQEMVDLISLAEGPDRMKVYLPWRRGFCQQTPSGLELCASGLTITGVRNTAPLHLHLPLSPLLDSPPHSWLSQRTPITFAVKTNNTVNMGKS